jgi:23S rRNA (cytidine1920-2'-O)/16S rRNA (cytidine1409-2'-O)-methyltransferase
MPPFVSRAGRKLDAALDAFDLDVGGWVCADLGSHTGGFVDCLLRRGAAKVYAVERGTRVLHWRLRTDPRVVVQEGCNALHWRPPAPVDLVTIDLGWTPQRLAVKAALQMCGPEGRVISLVKPQYEARADQRRGGVVTPESLAEVVADVRRQLGELGVHVAGWMASPLRGTGGNVEHLALLAPAGA